MEGHIRELLASENHKAIFDLEGSEYNHVKGIAAIHLEDYKKALEYLDKRSFEHAYALYKMHKYRKALKIAKKLDTIPGKTLTAQCLYFLGYYGESQRLLSSVSTEDEFAVNLAAIESLDYLNRKNKALPSLFATKIKGSECLKIANITTKSSLISLEYNYNRLFTEIEDERKFIRGLNNLYSENSSKNTCVDKQLRNLHGEYISKLGKREREVIEFNLGTRTAFTDPVHFQKNFDLQLHTEYALFYSIMNREMPNDKKPAYKAWSKALKQVKKSGFESEKIRFLRAYTAIKANKITEKEERSLSACEQSPLKDGLQLLMQKKWDKYANDSALAVLKRLRGDDGM